MTTGTTQPGDLIVGNGADFRIEQWRSYEIDFGKVNTLEDVLAVLRGLQITVTFQDPPTDNWLPLLPYLKAKP